MSYITFDTFPEESLAKQRESMFTSGSNGEKLPQYIIDEKAKHTKNIEHLKAVLDLFLGEELAATPTAKLTKQAEKEIRRLEKEAFHVKAKGRLDQELKWAKHFAACENEHKKGAGLHKIKTDLEAARKKMLESERAAREEKSKALIEERKKNRAELWKEFEANRKKKRKEAREKRRKEGWLYRLWTWLFPPAEKKDEPKKANVDKPQGVAHEQGPTKDRRKLLKKQYKDSQAAKEAKEKKD